MDANMSLQMQTLISILVVPTMQFLKKRLPKYFDVNGPATLGATVLLTGAATYFANYATGHPLTPEQMQSYTGISSLASVFLHQVLKTVPTTTPEVK